MKHWSTKYKISTINSILKHLNISPLFFTRRRVSPPGIGIEATGSTRYSSRIAIFFMPHLHSTPALILLVLSRQAYNQRRRCCPLKGARVLYNGILPTHLLVTSASDLSMSTVKCSVVFGVTSMLPVINN